MARTKASACRKSSGGKAQHKTMPSGSTPKSVGSSGGGSSSKGSGSIKKNKGSASINGVCQRATPEWQKKITLFMNTRSSDAGESTSKANDENVNFENEEILEVPSDTSNGKTVKDEIMSDEENGELLENGNEESNEEDLEEENAESADETSEEIKEGNNAEHKQSDCEEKEHKSEVSREIKSLNCEDNEELASEKVKKVMGKGDSKNLVLASEADEEIKIKNDVENEGNQNNNNKENEGSGEEQVVGNTEKSQTGSDLKSKLNSSGNELGEQKSSENEELSEDTEDSLKYGTKENGHTDAEKVGVEEKEKSDNQVSPGRKEEEKPNGTAKREIDTNDSKECKNTVKKAKLENGTKCEKVL